MTALPPDTAEVLEWLLSQVELAREEGATYTANRRAQGIRVLTANASPDVQRLTADMPEPDHPEWPLWYAETAAELSEVASV